MYQENEVIGIVQFQAHPLQKYNLVHLLLKQSHFIFYFIWKVTSSLSANIPCPY